MKIEAIVSPEEGCHGLVMSYVIYVIGLLKNCASHQATHGRAVWTRVPGVARCSIHTVWTSWSLSSSEATGPRGPLGALAAYGASRARITLLPRCPHWALVSTPPLSAL